MKFQNLMLIGKIQNVEFEAFSNVFSTQSSKTVSLRQLFEIISTNEVLKVKTNQIRKALTVGDKKRVEALKRSLPCIVPHALFEGAERSVANAVRHTGILMIDIDDCPDQTSRLLNEAMNIPYVVMAFESCSGRGVHLLLAADCSLDNHTRCYVAACDMIEERLGVKPDAACKDLARFMMLNHDAGCRFNPNAAVWRCPPPAPVPVPVNNPVTPPDLREAQIQKWRAEAYFYRASQNLLMTEGNRHNSTVAFAHAANRAGICCEELETLFVGRYAAPDFDAKEIRQIFRSVYEGKKAFFGVNSRAQQRLNGAGGIDSNTTVAESMKERSEPTIEPSDLVNGDLMLPIIPQRVYERLPEFLQRAVSKSECAVFRDIDLLTALTFAGSVFHNATAVVNGRLYYPTLMFALVGESGSGKGRCGNLLRMLAPWHRYIEEQSQREVDRYEEQLEFYNDYHRTPRAKRSGPAPARPVEVMLKNLLMGGTSSCAKMSEDLKANAPHTAVLVELELGAVNRTLNSDFGEYTDILNKVYHHEPISVNTKAKGSMVVRTPKMSMLTTGTPSMFADFVKGTESGLYSRLIVYRLRPDGHYYPLTSEDDADDAGRLFDYLGFRLCEMGQFMEGHEVRMRITENQRRKLNEVFGERFESNYAFGLERFNNISSRHLIDFFRVALILTLIRAAENKDASERLVLSEEDFEIALDIVQTLYRHAVLVSTMFEEKDKKNKVAERYIQSNVPMDRFARLPEVFRRSDLFPEVNDDAGRRKVSRILKKLIDAGFVERREKGLYRKTDKGVRMSDRFLRENSENPADGDEDLS